MNTAAFLGALEADGRAIIAAAERGLDAPVPTTPGWDVGDVVAHLGGVHRQTARIVGESIERPARPEPPGRDKLLSWFEEGLEQLVAELAGADPAASASTWYAPDQSVGFWIRRMAHETLIHRVDTQLGHGAPTPVDPELAADGVDEIFSVFMSGRPAWAEVTPSVVVEVGSEGRTWKVQFISWSGTSPRSGRTVEDRPGIALITEGDQPVARVRGPGNALDLFLWGRGSADGLIVDGHPSVLLYLRDVAAAATG